MYFYDIDYVETTESGAVIGLLCVMGPHRSKSKHITPAIDSEVFDHFQEWLDDYTSQELMDFNELVRLYEIVHKRLVPVG